MKAKSIKGKSAGEIKIALEESMYDGFKPTLAIVFLSINLDRNAVCKLLDNKGILIFGSTAAGEFIDGEFEKDSMAILLLDINKESYVVHLEERMGKSKFRTASSIAKKGLECFTNPAYIVAAGGSIIDGETIIEGINSVSENKSIIYGGITGDKLRGTITHLFTNNKFTEDGIIALIVDNSQIQLSGLATHGWKPVGTIRTVTDCEDCKIYTIDDEPALDIMVKFLGISIDDYTADEIINNIGNLDPIQLLRDNGNTITRAIRNIDTKERSILLAGPVKPGTKIRFSLPPDNNIIQKVTKDSLQLKESLKTESEAMIMFSCISRFYSLGPLLSSEIEDIKNVWNTAMTGLFCYGEIGESLNGLQEFHNNTCCYVILKEI